MKGFLFRAKRSSFLQGFVLVCLSFLTGFLVTAAVIIRLMLHFGMQYDPITGEGMFSEWLYGQSIYYPGAYSFFMSFHPILVQVAADWLNYIWIPVVLGLMMCFMFIYLMRSAGYHGNKESPCLRGLEKIPFDILLPCMLLITGVFYMLLLVVLDHYRISFRVLGGICAGAAVIGCILELLRFIAAKTRTGTLISGMLITKLFRAVMLCIRNIPFVWKVAAAWAGCLGVVYTLVLWLYWLYAYYYYMDDFFVLTWTLIVVVLFFLGIWVILQMNLVRVKARQLAEGNLEQERENPKNKITKKGGFFILPVFRKCLQDLDRISDGMNVIVEEKMKSERFQTELITNVSHDIKTPLTSIINYLDFLSQEEKKENRNPQVVKEYIEVLDRQSVRLKKLIEDLIEASKASTGSLNISMEPCALGIFLQQLSGEYEERLEASGLKLNLSLPKTKIYVEADGRYLWRVLDNLLQNACKYAMTGTRVYLQLQEKAGQAIIVMKNISASELNISAEELLERFVRGDRSRHTEGSGLGLSIARSLTELQGGKFAIEIDGDLFKTAVGFSVIEPPRTEEDKKEEPVPSEDGNQSSEKRSLTADSSMLAVVSLPPKA